MSQFVLNNTSWHVWRVFRKQEVDSSILSVGLCSADTHVIEGIEVAKGLSGISQQFKTLPPINFQCRPPSHRRPMPLQ